MEAKEIESFALYMFKPLTQGKGLALPEMRGALLKQGFRVKESLKVTLIL